MTKSTIVNQIQLDFQAKTGGLKASRSEVARLNRLLQESRSPAEKFRRNLEVLHQQFLKGDKKGTKEYVRGQGLLMDQFLKTAKGADDYRERLELVMKMMPRARKAFEQKYGMPFDIYKMVEPMNRQIALEKKQREAAEKSRHALRKSALEAEERLRQFYHQREIKRLQSEQAAVQKRMRMYTQMPSMQGRGGRLMGAATDLASAVPGGGALAGMAGMGAPVAIGAAAIAGAGMALSEYKKLEESLATLEVQFGSAQVAQQKFEEMRKIAAESPLAVTDFVASARTMAQFGMEAENIVPKLEQLSKISAGNGERFQALALAFSQSKAAGRLMGQEVLQFTNAGFNPLMQISKDLNIEMATLKKMVEEGKVSFQDVADAVESATRKGGQFADMNDRLKETLSGKMSIASDSLTQSLQKVGEALAPLAKMFLSVVAEAANMFNFYMDLFSAIGKDFQSGQFFGSNAVEFFNKVWYATEETADNSRELYKNFGKAAKETEKMAANMAKIAKADVAFEKLVKLDEIESLIQDLDKLTKGEDAAAIADFAKKARQAAIAAVELAEVESGSLMTASQKAQAIADRERQSKEQFAFLQQRIKYEERIKELQEEGKRITESLMSPEAIVNKSAQDLALLVRVGAISQRNATRELARVMTDNLDSLREVNLTLPQSIQAGTQEAYQAIVQVQNNRQNQQLNELRKARIENEAHTELLRKIEKNTGDSQIGVMN